MVSQVVDPFPTGPDPCDGVVLIPKTYTPPVFFKGTGEQTLDLTVMDFFDISDPSCGLLMEISLVDTNSCDGIVQTFSDSLYFDDLTF